MNLVGKHATSAAVKKAEEINERSRERVQSGLDVRSRSHYRWSDHRLRDVVRHRPGCVLRCRQFLLPEEAGEYCREGLHQPNGRATSRCGMDREVRKTCTPTATHQSKATSDGPLHQADLRHLRRDVSKPVLQKGPA